ncbi:MAG: ABC transporter substrate-binding protein [Bacteroidia bacterium]
MQLVDQIGHQLNIKSVPKRIISVVPSQTEFLFYLGLKDEIVGRTRFCIHPKSEIKRVKNIGGTKQLKLGEIEQLQPDLIIANKEENDKEQIRFLQKKYPVYTSDILTVDSAFTMITDVGRLCGTEEKAIELVFNIKKGINELPKIKASVAYLIWYQPYMAAAKETYIDELLKILGFQNVFGDFTRYPQIGIKQLIETKPSHIFLSSEPFPFKQKHIDEIQDELPNSKIVLVDGEMFSWYGNRMLLAVDYFQELLNGLAK